MSSRTDCSGKSKSAHLHCMTQNSFHAENKTDCAAGREDFERSSAVASIPSQFYCFESCINGNGQGKLYDLVELKYIIEAKVVKNNENSDFNLSNETTKRDRLDLRRSMTPEATQSNKLMKRHSIEYKESKLEHVEHALPRKTVHFLPRSKACFFRNDELPLPNPQNFATNRNRKLHFQQDGSTFKTLPKDLPCYISLRNLKILSGQKQQPSKKDRLRLREYRLQKWVNLAENEYKSSNAELLSPNESSELCLRNHLTPTNQPERPKRTMQERALSNLSKIEAALSNSFSNQQQYTKNCDSLVSRADSGVWCELTSERNKLFYSKPNVNAQSRNRLDAEKFNSNFLFRDDQSNRSKTTSNPDVLHQVNLTSSSCRSHQNTPRTSKSPVVSCSWYQNSISLSSKLSELDGNFSALNVHEDDSEMQKYCQELPAHLNKHLTPQFCRADRNGDVQHAKRVSMKVKKDRHKDQENSCTEPHVSSCNENNGVTETKNLINKRVYDTTNYLLKHSEVKSVVNTEKDSTAHIRHMNKTLCYDRGKLSLSHNGVITTNLSKADISKKEQCCDGVQGFVHCEAQSVSSCIRCRNNPESNCDKLFCQNNIPSSLPRRTCCACMNNARALCANDVNAAKLVKAFTPIFVSSQPGYIAIKNGDGRAILLKCSCKSCLKAIRQHQNRTSKLSGIKTASSIRHRTKILKSDSYRKGKLKPTISNKSSKSNFSSNTRSSSVGVWSLCFRCFNEDSMSSMSGGSDTDNDDGDDCDEDDGFDEHGEEVSADEDSGGGDSGSDSGGDESLNSAELYDDQNNMTDARQAMGEGDDSDGPASLESECSDSLTELRSKTKRGSKSNDEDEDDDKDEISEDEDQFADSWESFAIYDGD